ncbi:MAG: hypothetical protein WCF65_09550 [Parachlamydiaceae bacterium]
MHTSKFSTAANRVDGPTGIADGERRSHHRSYGSYNQRFIKLWGKLSDNTQAKTDNLS